MSDASQTDGTSVSINGQLRSSARVYSIDAYRGFVMFLMMAEMVQLPELADYMLKKGDQLSSISKQFWSLLHFHTTHVPWVGCSLHDMIQPSFSFLVGTALVFSLANRAKRNEPASKTILHAVWRSIVLVLLGIFLRSMHSKQTNFTFEDTLSQIGLGYTFLVLAGLAGWQVSLGLVVVLLGGYWAWFAAHPLPAADFDWSTVNVAKDWPHHVSGFAQHWDKNVHPAAEFDRWFLNLFPRETPWTYHSGGYMTLSFIPTLATMLLGYLAGVLLKQSLTPKNNLPELFRELGPTALPQWAFVASCLVIGTALVSGGWALNHYGYCPIVKRIWTPSWTLYSGGICFIMLAVFFTIADWLKQASVFYPLIVIGANSIVAYCLAHGPDSFIRQSLKIHVGDKPFNLLGDVPELRQTLIGVVTLSILWLILSWMYRRKIFVRI